MTCPDCNGRGAYDDPPWGIVRCLRCNGTGFVILAAHPGPPEPRVEVTDEPSLTNPLTPYGMLCRALRIVTGALLYDMAKHMRMSSATLSAMEFGRRPVTYTDACGAADFFEERGIPNMLPVLQRAIDATRTGASS